MKKGLLICFTGMDGTGKTTLARETVKYLRAQHIPCRYLWFNYRRLLWLLGKKPHHNNFLLLFWYIASIFEYLIFFVFEIFPSLCRGKVVVCDRYLHDVIANLKHKRIYKRKLQNAIMLIGRQPDIIFLIDAPPEVAYNRRKEGLLQDYILKRNLYINISNLVNCVVISTKKSYQENLGEIIAALSVKIDD